MGELASISSWFNTWLESFRGPIVYVLCGLLVFGEASILLGFVIPGETAALVGGALASLHHANLFVMLSVIIVAAIVGDSVGFEVGKRLGPWLLGRRPMRRNLGVEKARFLIEKRGGPAVFLGRWIALARALVPGIAGMSGMRYRTFFAYNAAGGIAWGTTFVLLGFVAGRSYQRIASTIGEWALVVVGVIVLALVILVAFRRRRERQADQLG
ncbi:MAG TPA: DedA family protein [Acidimicrobiales bacterium]|nr:DedA family protein [Acidimicrobiales bacterium]